METLPIIIDKGQVTIRPVAGAVWMTQHQIANLFDVFVSAVGINIRSIFKNKVLREEKVCRTRTHRDGSFTTLYNLEMIAALAFRLKSRNAELFRRWIVEQALNPVVIWRIPGTDAILN